MQFDHRPGTEKEAAVSAMAVRGASRKRLKEEIKKCDVVCASCHTNRTYFRLIGEEIIPLKY
jgi:hypothetical protein